MSQLRTLAQVIQLARQKLPHISDLASEVTQRHLYLIRLITSESLKGSDIDLTSSWKDYKGHVVREKHVG